MPHQSVIPLACPSAQVEVFRRVCPCLYLFRTAQVKSERPQPLGWRQHLLVDSGPAFPCLCLYLFQMV